MMTKLQDYKIYLENIHRSLVYYNYNKILFSYLQATGLKLEELNKEQLAQFFHDKEYKPNSINNFIKSGRDYCRFLNIEKSAFFEIKLLEVEKRLPEYLTLDDIEKAIKYIATYNYRLSSDKIEAMLYFMFFTGVRKSEVLNLKRECFDFEKLLVKIYSPKTKEEKLIPFPNRIKKKLENYFKSEEEKENAFNINQSQLDYLFQDIMTKHLGKKCKAHLTRHGGFRYLLEKGIPVTIVQRIAGHKSVFTTLQYLSPDQEMIERIYKEKIV